jgi:hypothetical protein
MRSVRFILFKSWIILVYILSCMYLVSHLSFSFFVLFFRLYKHEIASYAVYNLKHLLKYIRTLAFIENRLVVTV